jgi:hypothetical protein
LDAEFEEERALGKHLESRYWLLWPVNGKLDEMGLKKRSDDSVEQTVCCVYLLSAVDTTTRHCELTLHTCRRLTVRKQKLFSVDILGGISFIRFHHFKLQGSTPSPLSSTMSVSLVSNSYLDENSTRIRSKPVPWEVRIPA